MMLLVLDVMYMVMNHDFFFYSIITIFKSNLEQFIVTLFKLFASGVYRNVLFCSFFPTIFFNRNGKIKKQLPSLIFSLYDAC